VCLAACCHDDVPHQQQLTAEGCSAANSLLTLLLPLACPLTLVLLVLGLLLLVWLL
jgi:hypothetical protein